MNFSGSTESSESSPIAPLLDVVLLLLIFFVVTTSFTNQQLDVTLPEAQTGAASIDDALVISVDAEGRFSIGEKSASLAGVRESLDFARDDERAVEIRADEATRHGHVVELLDLARRSGVSQLGITVARESRPENPADREDRPAGGAARR